MEEFLSDVLIRAGEIAEKLFGDGVQSRVKGGPDDIVTEADDRVNEFLIREIQQAFPSHRIHSEELKEDINPSGTTEWIIDPIDGTRNFAAGNPLWCIMVGVTVEEERELAGIYCPMLKAYYFAARGRGAYLNGKAIKVNAASNIDCGLGFLAPAVTGVQFERYLNGVNAFLRRGGWLVNNATMLSAAFLATGSVDFFASNCGFDHDYVAPALLCEEAGARVTDIDGNRWSRGHRDIVIANPLLHEAVLGLLSGEA